jgi:6-phosphogluconate dehydrogenase (decarboxylating)
LGYTAEASASQLGELSQIGARLQAGAWKSAAKWLRCLPRPAFLSASVIAASLYERFESRDAGAFTGKILSAMRSEFGGHMEKKA